MSWAVVAHLISLGLLRSNRTPIPQPKCRSNESNRVFTYLLRNQTRLPKIPTRFMTRTRDGRPASYAKDSPDGHLDDMSLQNYPPRAIRSEGTQLGVWKLLIPSSTRDPPCPLARYIFPPIGPVDLGKTTVASDQQPEPIVSVVGSRGTPLTRRRWIRMWQCSFPRCRPARL